MKPRQLSGFRADAPQGLEPIGRDANGYLRFEARVARVGVVSYADVGGGRELTPPEVLFDPESMASLPGVPVTEEHPDPILLTPETAPAAARGAVLSYRQDGDYLVATGVIWDAVLAAKVESKEKREVSPGYRFEATAQSGTWSDGERFDSRQVARIYNHLAFSRRGRCSATCGGGACQCAARVDAQGAPMRPKKRTPNQIGARADAPSSQALMELCAKAYPDDVKAALAAYAEIMGQNGEAPPAKEPGEEQPAQAGAAGPFLEEDEEEDDDDYPRARGDSSIAAIRAELAAEKAARTAAEKALERQTRAHADSAGRDISRHLEAIERYRTVTGARADSIGGMTIDQLDRASLLELYPEDKAEIEKYSTVELQAHVKQAFHPTRGDHRIRAARENQAGVHADAVRPGAKVSDQEAWDKEIEAERVFNGGRPRNGAAQ